MGEPVGEIAFPPEWKVGKKWGPGYPEILLTGDEGRIFAAGGCLRDGTNLMGLCWPGGQRVYRTGPDTGWALEERFDEAGPAPERIVQVWRILIEATVNSAREVERLTGGRPGSGAA
jgi:hypothetical protein